MRNQRHDTDHLSFRFASSESSLLEFLEALDETHPRNLVVISHNGHFHRYTKRQVSLFNVEPDLCLCHFR